MNRAFASRFASSLGVAGGVVGLALTACAAPSGGDVGGDAATSAPAPIDVRVLVKLVRASGDGGAIAAAASRQAGVAVRYAAAASPSWHALSLRCSDAGQCEAAIERLRADRSTYESVEREGRKQRAVM